MEVRDLAEEIDNCDCEFCRKENDLRLAIRLGAPLGNKWLEQAPEKKEDKNGSS